MYPISFSFSIDKRKQLVRLEFDRVDGLISATVLIDGSF